MSKKNDEGMKYLKKHVNEVFMMWWHFSSKWSKSMDFEVTV